jgi:hypothetical protein
LKRIPLKAALLGLIAHPRQRLIGQWNWKAAITSSMVRGFIFLFANLSAGWKAAVGAMLAEWVFRTVTSGFYGTVTQALGEVEPEWQGTLCAVILLPVFSHSLEFLLHWLRHTPNLRTSLISSIGFTVFSTLFNLHAMRRGTLIVGEGAPTLAADFRALPRLIAGFVIGILRLPWGSPAPDCDSAPGCDS